jgi:hypothetical protein
MLTIYSSNALLHRRDLVQKMKAVKALQMSLEKVFGKFRFEEGCVLLMLGWLAIASRSLSNPFYGPKI